MEVLHTSGNWMELCCQAQIQRLLTRQYPMGRDHIQEKLKMVHVHLLHSQQVPGQ